MFGGDKRLLLGERYIPIAKENRRTPY